MGKMTPVEEPTARDLVLLEMIANPHWPVIPATDVAVVVAHPDDETIGCGAQLARLRGQSVILVTDGAPRKHLYAQRSGFHSIQAYGAARRREFLTALALAGVPEHATIMIGVPDQEAASCLVAITRQLVRTFLRRRVRVVLTHSYEGGHPDHDATAFAVHAAATTLARCGHHISIIEMPLYRMGAKGRAVQSFTNFATQAVTVSLVDESKTLKRRMIAAHETQQRTLRMFSAEVESFRLAPCYEFTSLPNRGRLLYELFPWRMTGARWLSLVYAANNELGIGLAR